jgi:hypothetical protein
MFSLNLSSTMSSVSIVMLLATEQVIPEKVGRG